MLFGTINGVIGVVASLPQPQFQLLEALQVCTARLCWLHAGFDMCCLSAALLARASQPCTCLVPKKTRTLSSSDAHHTCKHLPCYPVAALVQEAMRKVVKGVGGLDHGEVSGWGWAGLFARPQDGAPLDAAHLAHAGAPHAAQVPCAPGVLHITLDTPACLPAHPRALPACSGAPSATSTSRPPPRASLWMAI